MPRLTAEHRLALILLLPVAIGCSAEDRVAKIHQEPTLLRRAERVIASSDPPQQPLSTTPHALSSAIINGDIDLVRSILSHNPEVITQLPRDAAIDSLPFPSVLRELANAGLPLTMRVTINSTSGNNPGLFEVNATLLHYCSYLGNTQSAQFLLNAGLAVNATDNQGHTPLMVTTHSDMVDFLVNIDDVDLNARTTRGWTALHFAAIRGDTEIVRSLVSMGAKVVRRDDGATPIIAASRELWPDNLVSFDRYRQVIKLLEQHGDEKDLFAAIVTTDSAQLRTMLERDPDLSNSVDHRGLPLLTVAAEHGSLACAKILVEYGADVDARDNVHGTPLYAAATWNRLDLVEFLIAHEADPNARTTGGTTPLHMAARRESIPLVRALLVAGADIAARDRGGRTPLDYAKDQRMHAPYLDSPEYKSFVRTMEEYSRGTLTR